MTLGPLSFRPMPWLTVITVLGFALLLKLGFWQKDRLVWKAELLERVDAAAKAPPLTSLAEIEAALTADDPVDFRRYVITATTVPGGAYAVYDPSGGDISWRVYARIEQGGRAAYLATQPMDDEMKSLLGIGVDRAESVQSSGYIRLAAPPPSAFGKLIKAKPNPKSNRWFSFNQDDLWADEWVDMRYWLDSRAQTVRTDLLPLRPDIPNNHRDYMWTWFSFAGLLVLFYALIHRRAGRLTIGRATK